MIRHWKAFEKEQNDKDGLTNVFTHKENANGN